jgi:hypothetical protein
MNFLKELQAAQNEHDEDAETTPDHPSLCSFDCGARWGRTYERKLWILGILTGTVVYALLTLGGWA